jgi:hypothetical protein
MAHLDVISNELRGRDPDLARRFELEIEAAMQDLPRSRVETLVCRILAWQRRGDLGARDRVTLLFALPGWVKAISVPIQAAPGQVQEAAAMALAPRFAMA